MFNQVKFKIMAVEHTPSGIVHDGSKGSTTACGTNTNDHYDHWRNTSSKVTCKKKGCA